MYFENWYKEPVFTFKFGSVLERIIHDYPRTTSKIEAWNRGFNSLINRVNSDLGKFCNILQIKTEKARVRIAKHKVGEF